MGCSQCQNLQIDHCQNRFCHKVSSKLWIFNLEFLFSILYLPFFRYDGFLNGKHHNGTKSGRYKDRIEYYSDQHLHNQQIHHSMENRWEELEICLGNYFLNSESRLLQMQVEGRGKIQNLMIFPRSLPGRNQLLVTTATGNLKISHSKIKQKMDQSFIRSSLSVNGKPVQLNGGCRIHGSSTENVQNEAVKV